MPTPPLPPSPASPGVAANDGAPGPSHAQWADIVQQLGAEIAGPLSTALERIHGLISTGQIDRQSLRALRESVAEAREAGMVGQQLARLASGRLRLSRERLHLTQLLRGVLAHRSRETQARGIQVRQMLKPVEVVADGALLFSLLNALMDWALSSTHSSVDLRLDLSPWPPRARLTCRFAHRALELADEPHAVEPTQAMNSLAWRLVEQTALTLGVLPLRESEAGITVLTLEFPNTITDEAPAGDLPPAVPEPDTGHDTEATPSQYGNSKPLAGSHVLIVTARRDLRAQIQTAIAHMGLIVDVVGTMAEAAEFCREGLPHGILFESSLRDGPDFEQLQFDILSEVPQFSFVEVLDGDQHTQLSTATADGLARIASAHLTDALPSMLMFELSKGL